MKKKKYTGKKSNIREQNTIASGGVVGDYESTAGNIGNKDTYAEGDARIPTFFASASGEPIIQTRKGPKKGNKKIKKEGFNQLYVQIIKHFTD